MHQSKRNSLCLYQMLTATPQACRYFASIVRSDLYLQYKLELAQNGMVDGASSTLPLSDRLQRLRRYSSNFQRGIFDREYPGAHHCYLPQVRNLSWNAAMPGVSSFSNLYGLGYRDNRPLPVFIPGSKAAGIESSRFLLPIGTAAEPGLLVTNWAIDDAQDLLVVAEVTDRLLFRCVTCFTHTGWLS